MAVSFWLSTLCFFFLLVALAVSDKTLSKEEGANSASMENNSLSDEHFAEETTCEEGTPPQPAPTPTPTTLPLLDFCRSKTNGNYINPNDCKTYITCSNGDTYIMDCPANLVYNEAGWCDYVQNVLRCL